MWEQLSQVLAAPLPAAQEREAVKRASRATSNLPPGAQLYPGLPPLEVASQPQRMGKQLHPGWVASRQARPELGALWSAKEQQPGVVRTCPVALYERPRAQQVAEALLDLQLA